MYLLWRDPRMELTDFVRQLRTGLAAQLACLGALGVQLNVADEDASGAALTFRSSRPQMEAFVSLWIHSANDAYRQPYDDAVGGVCGRFAAYLVTESQPLVNTRYPALSGERTQGFAQIALFQRPPRLTHAAWLDIWLGSHTQIAIDTQDNFLYVQNVVTRALTFDAPRYNAIVEECFPPRAFGDVRAFYDAPGDDEKYRRNEACMMESCKRFIDFNRLDVVQTSQYVVKLCS